MAIPFLVLTSFLFLLKISKSVYGSAESNIDWDDRIDWKLAVNKIRELEKLVKVQDERIFILEKRPAELKWKLTTDLENTIRKKNDRIGYLEARISELESMLDVKENKPVKTESTEWVFKSNQATNTSKRSLIAKERLLIQPTPFVAPIESVAFFAYLSQDTPKLGDLHTLTFDTVITNVLNAYHPHLGAFISPRSGLFVFTWTIRLYQNNYHSTELVVDNHVINSIHFNPNNNIDGSVTGTAVVHVNQGDDEFIRTSSSYNSGSISSNDFGRSSFAGWSLM